MSRPMTIGVYTVASKNYLSFVRTLFASLARVHPEYRLFLCLTDRVDGCFDPAGEPYTVVEIERLGMPNFGDLTLRYDILELNCAAKPFMCRWVLDNTDMDAVIYLDSDIAVYSRLDRVEEALADGASVVLTPHITAPLEDGRGPDDFGILKAGVFNLGFTATRRCEESIAFMGWLGRRLLTQGASDQQNGLFVDQKWCDLAPCLLDNLVILKDAGYNVAYWNFAHRLVARADDGRWVVNGLPLAFLHFSGIDPSNRRLISRFQDRFAWDDIAAIQPLFEAYHDALMRAGWQETRAWPYAFDALDDGRTIPQPVRLLYREEHPLPTAVSVDESSTYLRALCNMPSPDVPADEDLRISKLMYLIYRYRPDLHATYSLQTPDGRRAFAAWFEDVGQDFGLGPEFTQQQLIRR